jgi:protein-S-isoprenylcysteine O-methyltransferase Ste14
MARSAAVTRMLTVAAAVFLGFDGAALSVVGVWTSHYLLLIVGLCLFCAAGLVLIYWRWHERQLREIAEARRRLRDEARALRDLIQRN